MIKPLRQRAVMPSFTEADVYSHQSDPEAWVQHHVDKAKAANEPHAILVTIDPPLMAAMLARNPVHWNRKISKKGVEKLSGVFLRDEWEVNGETIVFALTGEMNDGQHRLSGGIKANKSFRTFVVFGVSRESRTTLDQGKRRSMLDMLQMRGYQNVNNLGSAAATFLGYLHRDLNILTHGGATPQEILAVLEDHPDLAEPDAWSGAARMNKAFRVSPGVYVAIHYLLTKKSRPIAEAFFQSLIYGVGIDHVNDPRSRLASRLREHATRAHRLNRAELLALTIKAWNAWTRGEHVSSLSWRRGGKFEELPLIDDFDKNGEARMLKRINA